MKVEFNGNITSVVSDFTFAGNIKGTAGEPKFDNGVTTVEFTLDKIECNKSGSLDNC